MDGWLSLSSDEKLSLHQIFFAGTLAAKEIRAGTEYDREKRDDAGEECDASTSDARAGDAGELRGPHRRVPEKSGRGGAASGSSCPRGMETDDEHAEGKTNQRDGVESLHRGISLTHITFRASKVRQRQARTTLFCDADLAQEPGTFKGAVSQLVVTSGSAAVAGGIHFHFK